MDVPAPLAYEDISPVVYQYVHVESYGLSPSLILRAVGTGVIGIESVKS